MNLEVFDTMKVLNKINFIQMLSHTCCFRYRTTPCTKDETNKVDLTNMNGDF